MTIKTSGFAGYTEPRTPTLGQTWIPSLNGACLVDDEGKETPITDRMIRKALEELDIAWHRENVRRAHRHKR